MAVLSCMEIEKATANFLSKYQDQLECKTYGYEEVVRSEGGHDPRIYIIKEGVFRIGRIDAWKSDITVCFAFNPHVIVPVSSIVTGFPSLFQIKSIKNSLANSNSLYEISIEQWNSLVGEDIVLKNLPKFVTHDNLVTFINLFSILRQNRKTEEIFSIMYDAQDPILNSGIPDKYVADFFGITTDTLRRIFNSKRLSKNKRLEPSQAATVSA